MKKVTPNAKKLVQNTKIKSKRSKELPGASSLMLQMENQIQQNSEAYSESAKHLNGAFLRK